VRQNGISVLGEVYVHTQVTQTIYFMHSIPQVVRMFVTEFLSLCFVDPVTYILISKHKLLT
jgi:hypothetical protein